MLPKWGGWSGEAGRSLLGPHTHTFVGCTHTHAHTHTHTHTQLNGFRQQDCGTYCTRTHAHTHPIIISLAGSGQTKNKNKKEKFGSGLRGLHSCTNSMPPMPALCNLNHHFGHQSSAHNGWSQNEYAEAGTNNWSRWHPAMDALLHLAGEDRFNT